MPEMDRRRPWELLLHGVRTSLDPRKLVLASVGLVLLPGGWGAIDAAALWTDLSAAAWRLAGPVRVLAEPMAAAMAPSATWGGRLASLLAVVWAVVVWGIVGGAIARISMLQLAERVGPAPLGPLRFAVRFAPSLIAAPLYLLAWACTFALGCAGFGLLGRLPAGIGPALVRVLFFVPLVLALGAAVCGLALLAAWPLLHASVAAEAEDAVDAVSRSLGYLNRRLGKFVAVVCLCSLIGVTCLLAVDSLAWGVLRLAASWVGLPAPGGAGIPVFWQHTIGLAVSGWIHAYFWTQASYAYLILRRDVDGTAWTAVDRSREEAQPPDRGADGTQER
jgi:hypothetical protein